MIVRISGEGQYRVDDATAAELNELDGQLEAALASGETVFSHALAAMLAKVRDAGELLPDDELTESDAILPHAEATAAEVQAMLSDQGLVPD